MQRNKIRIFELVANFQFLFWRKYVKFNFFSVFLKLGFLWTKYNIPAYSSFLVFKRSKRIFIISCQKTKNSLEMFFLTLLNFILRLNFYFWPDVFQHMLFPILYLGSESLPQNPYIFATWWCKSYIFKTLIIWFSRIHSLKYLRSTKLCCIRVCGKDSIPFTPN